MNFVRFTISPMAGDYDADGLSNEYELRHGLSLTDASDAGLDADDDGLTNFDEFRFGTNPSAMDSDGDGVPDRADAVPTDPAFTFDRAPEGPYVVVDTIELADHERWATVNDLGTRVIQTNHANESDRFEVHPLGGPVHTVYGKFEGLNNRGDTSPARIMCAIR